MPLLVELSVSEIATLIRDGELLAEQVAEAYIDQTLKCESTLRAFVYFDREDVLSQARAVDEKRRKGDGLGLLAGVPIAIKDSICTSFAPTTCGSQSLVGVEGAWQSPYEATAVQRLRDADAIIFSKTNMDEFAMGSSTEKGPFSTRNPWDVSRVSGGSSGGSAASVAASMVPAALGSDTGGSIRQPASFTSCVGLKPTYGRVSRFGLVSFAPSLDQIGPIASDVRGASRILNVISGHDSKDSTSSCVPLESLEEACNRDISSIRIGLPIEYFQHPLLGLDKEVLREVQNALHALEDIGCELIPIRLPQTKVAIAAYYVLASAEASSNLARFDGIRFGHSHIHAARGTRNVQSALAATR
ncbi:MAG: Asp-tRNA(Asn)/Glu-tRNA(Gln) amidotransferase GatCAB subunit A, partial [Sorangium cellulosum]